MIWLKMLYSNIFRIEKNPRRKLWKIKRSVLWKNLKNNSASSLFYLSFEPLYCNSFYCTFIFLTVSVLGTYISACNIDAFCIYNFSIWLRNYTLALNALLLILLVALCSCFSTIARSLSFIHFFLEVQVYFFLYYCYCYLLFLFIFIALSSLRLLLPSFFLLSSNVYFIVQEQGACFCWGGKKPGSKVPFLPKWPLFAARWFAWILAALNVIVLRDFFEGARHTINLSTISKNKSQNR